MFKSKKLLLSIATVAVATVASACLFRSNKTGDGTGQPIVVKAQTATPDARTGATEQQPASADQQPTGGELVIKDITDQVPYGHEVMNRNPKDIDIIVIHSNYHVPTKADPDTFSTKGCIAQFRHYNVAAHYMVCRDATILRMVKEKDKAWQAGKSSLPGTNRTMLNPSSIGIEVVSTKTNGPTKEQYKALIALVKDICSRYDIKYMVRHADIAPTRRDDPWGFDWNWFCDQILLDYPNITVFRHKVKNLDHLS